MIKNKITEIKNQNFKVLYAKLLIKLGILPAQMGPSTQTP